MDRDIQSAARVFERRSGLSRRIDGTHPNTGCPGEPDPLLICPRYKLVVSADICRRCKVQPEFKQSLFASYIRNQAAREKPCRWAGEPTGTDTVKCCGGRYDAHIAHYIYTLHNAVTDPDCWVCADYEPKGER